MKKKFTKYILITAVLFTIILPFISLAQINFGGQIGTSVTNNSDTNIGGQIGTSVTNNSDTNIGGQIGTSTTFSSTGGCSATLPDKPKLGDVFDYVTCMISNSVIPLIFALAVAMFVWGVVQYVINNDEEAKKAKGRQFMIWGIIALTVMVSVWGLVSVLGNTFGVQNVLPKVNTTP